MDSSEMGRRPTFHGGLYIIRTRTYAEECRDFELWTSNCVLLQNACETLLQRLEPYKQKNPNATWRELVSFFVLTSLAVIPSVTHGKAKMQKMVTLSLTRSTDSETDGHAMVITVALRCGESVIKLIICGGVSISHAPCVPCHIDLIDTISCSAAVCWPNTVLSLIQLSLADGRRWESQALATSKPRR